MFEADCMCTLGLFLFLSFGAHFLDVKVLGVFKRSILREDETASSLDVLLNLLQKMYTKESNA